MREYLENGLFAGCRILNIQILEETRRGAIVDVVYWIEEPKQESYVHNMGKHIDWWKTISRKNELEIRVAELRPVELFTIRVYDLNSKPDEKAPPI